MNEVALSEGSDSKSCEIERDDKHGRGNYTGNKESRGIAQRRGEEKKNLTLTFPRFLSERSPSYYRNNGER